MKQSDVHIFIAYTLKLCSEGLELLIERNKEFKVTGSGPYKSDLNQHLNNHVKIDVLLLELNQLQKRDLQYIGDLVRKYPLIKVLVLSPLPQVNLSIMLIESGVDAFVSKACSTQELFNALDTIRRGENYFSPEIIRNVLSESRIEADEAKVVLTKREKEILALLVKCESNCQIARELGVSENTIKTHRRNIKVKFGVDNLIGMVRFACRANLLDFGDDVFCSNCPFCPVFN